MEKSIKNHKIKEKTNNPKDSIKNKKHIKTAKNIKPIKKKKEKINKEKFFYLLISVLDIVFIIYFARKNIANYVTSKIEGRFFVGDSKDLLFGKNYIVIVFSGFIYIYVLLANKIFFQLKQSKKSMIKLFILIFFINTLLFFIFTKRVY